MENFSTTIIIFIIFSFYIFFLVKICLFNDKSKVHYLFIIFCFLIIVRILSVLFIRNTNSFNEKELIIIYKLISFSIIFLPTVILHMFSQLIKNQIKYLNNILIFLYIICIIFFVLFIFYNPVVKEFKIINDKNYTIYNTKSLLFYLWNIYILFAYLLSIYVLNKDNKIEMTKKDKMTINILKYSYILAFGYTYLIEVIITSLNYTYISKSSYFIGILSVVFYYVISRYNFLGIYKSKQYINLINKDFSIPFIITDENLKIKKSNIVEKYFNNTEQEIFNKNINDLFINSSQIFNTLNKEKSLIKDCELLFFDKINETQKKIILEINPLFDNYNDIIGTFIVIKDFKISMNSFSKREQEIIDYIKNNKSYKEISYHLNISINTVKSHIKNIYKKANVNNKESLIKVLY
ncbi:MAG: hypothetical protein A2Y34_01040 [Spirochaetes bacterium GWC1_27_15]|nr:MAG: hypothetical protein A2Z98_02945 [Spirochaetes bacterium GWB1_27_13]OHD22986.1 MAG: hypothetical protein A2Y34_01040 [Spirochaetes bacterium GWC1_27_15]